MTNVTKNVVQDLLPIYICGEASTDTRRLVEEWMSADPELRATVEAAGSTAPPISVKQELPDLLCMKSLDRTRQLLNRKTRLFGLSLFFSLLPMTCGFDDGRITFLMARDQPVTAVVALVAAIVGWIAYLATCRRLNATGMEPRRAWAARFRWALTGALLGASCMLVVRTFTGDSIWLRAIPPVFMFAALRIGEGFRQIARRR